jgi:hypothetical protein
MAIPSGDAGMSPGTLARELGIDPKTLRAWLRSTYGRPDGEHGSAWNMTRDQVDAARGRWGHTVGSRSSSLAHDDASGTEARLDTSARHPTRATSDEAYVIGLCDELLGEKARRQHRFSWLVGDHAAIGARSTLPVDAYYERHRLVVEYRERQHYEAVPFFDRRETVSGVGRGEQRRLYDRRREEEIPKHGLRLLIIRPEQLAANRRGRLLRNRTNDRAVLASLLEHR